MLGHKVSGTGKIDKFRRKNQFTGPVKAYLSTLNPCTKYSVSPKQLDGTCLC